MYLWEAWRGRNSFALSGFFFWPSELCPSMAVGPVIVGIIVFFCATELQRLEGGLLMLATLAIALAFQSLFFFVRMLVSDPGVLPRRELLPLLTLSPGGRNATRSLVEEYCGHCRLMRTSEDGQPIVRTPEGDEREKREMLEEVLSRFDQLPCIENPEESLVEEANAFWKELFMDSRLVHLKFCRTCKIRRPIKSSHCRYCDNCVLTYDHHCFWVGHCIGARNHQIFVCFLLTAGLGAALLAVVAALEALQTVCLHGLPNGVSWSDWRVVCLVLMTMLGAGFLAARYGLRRRPHRSSRKVLGAAAKQAPAPEGQAPFTPKPKVPFLHSRAGQSRLRQGTTAGLISVGVGSASLLATLLPWPPVFTILLMIGPTWLVSVTLQGQLNVLEARQRRKKESRRQGLARLWIFYEFLLETPIGQVSPMLADIDERWVPPKPDPDEKLESERSGGWMEAARHTALLCGHPDPADDAELGQPGQPGQSLPSASRSSSSRFSLGMTREERTDEEESEQVESEEKGCVSRSKQRSKMTPVKSPALHSPATLDDSEKHEEDSESSLLDPELSVKRKPSWIERAGSGDQGL